MSEQIMRGKSQIIIYILGERPGQLTRHEAHRLERRVIITLTIFLLLAVVMGVIVKYQSSKGDEGPEVTNPATTHIAHAAP